MFKLNNKSKKIMKALSLGIVSLGLLAGIGMSGNSNNAHAASSLDQEYLDDANESAAKDDAISDANEEKDRIKTDKVSPSDRISDEYEEENWGDNRFSKIAPAVFNGSYVKGSKADQRADTNFINKYMKHETKSTKKSKKHVNRHDKNLARNKRAKRASRRTRRAKKHSYKKAKLVKRSRSKKAAKVVKKSTRRNWRHVRPSKNHLSKLTKNHKKGIKKAHKFNKLTKKQVKHFNSLLRKDKRSLKSKKAKHNYKYRKTLTKNIKLIQKSLNTKK